MKNILCIDAGFSSCGFAVVELPTERIVTFGTIETKPTNKKHAVRVADDTFRRCQEVFRQLSAVVQDCGIKAVVVELPNGGAKSANAAKCMAMASSIVACLVESFSLPCEPTTPDAGKRLVNPKGAVTKDEVAEHVQNHWDLPLPLPEHVSDALAAYLVARDGQLIRVLKGAS